MMNQQPDNFFREKLANYRKPAPAGAWDKVTTALDKSDNSFAWWKIAASLLLFSAVGSVLWFHTSPSTQQPIAQMESQNPQTKQENDQVKINPPAESQDQATTNDRFTSAAENISEKKVRPKKIRKESNITHTLDAAVPVRKEDSSSDSETLLSGTPEVEVEHKIPATKKSPGLTLTFTVDETNQYLDKNAVAQATPEEKKSSTFKKLLRKANDLKSNQDPFGDLREKKNEILALNFKNDKRGQNK